jgi:hypothetical protein
VAFRSPRGWRYLMTAIAISVCTMGASAQQPSKCAALKALVLEMVVVHQRDLDVKLAVLDLLERMDNAFASFLGAEAPRTRMLKDAVKGIKRHLDRLENVDPNKLKPGMEALMEICPR